MAKIVKFSKLASTLRAGFQNQMNKSNQFMSLLGTKIDQQAQTVFRTQGNSLVLRGMRSWPKFSPNTLQTKGGTFRKRPGTDGAKTRRYSNNSKLLQASGLFRKSFGIVRATDKKLLYGTQHQLAKQIMRKPSSQFHRPIIVRTASDLALYNRMFRNWYAKGLTF